MNQKIKNGNACIHSFPGATSHQLHHYLDVNLDKYTATVVIHIGVNDILNSASNVNGLLLNIKDMIKKCRNFGVKYIFRIWFSLHQENNNWIFGRYSLDIDKRV